MKYVIINDPYIGLEIREPEFNLPVAYHALSSFEQGNEILNMIARREITKDDLLDDDRAEAALSTAFYRVKTLSDEAS